MSYDRQLQQEAFLREQELLEIKYYHNLFNYSFSCKTCGVSKSFHTAGVGLILLDEHLNHDTYFEYLGLTDPRYKENKNAL